MLCAVLYSQNLIKMDKIVNSYDGSIWIKADKDIRDYPIGTRFKSITGGCWTRTSTGFKWGGGDTFPSVGGDWNGYVCIP